MTEYSIDDFTIHCVEMTIKELIMNNEDYQRNIDSQNNTLEYLIFENRKLVLYELLGKIQQLKKVLGAILLEVKRDISNTNQTGEIRVFINPHSFNFGNNTLSIRFTNLAK